MKRKGFGKGLYTVAISAMFLGGFLLLVVFGATSYRRVTSIEEGNRDHRAILSYLSTSLKADRASDIIIESKEGVSVLTILDEDGEYGKRIYLYEGNLVEDYGKADGKLFPKEATKIGDTGDFEIVYEDGLLRLITDEGEVDVDTKMREVIFR